MANEKQATNDFKDMTFREGMTKLDELVNSLESGSLELEESLSKYAEGVQLISELQKRLTAAEQQVEVLMGELEDAPDDETRDTTLNKA